MLHARIHVLDTTHRSYYLRAAALIFMHAHYLRLLFIFEGSYFLSTDDDNHVLKCVELVQGVPIK